MPSNFHRYLLVFGACTMCGLAGVAALNLFVDPIGAYPALSLRALEPYRQQIVSRPAKAELVKRRDCDVALLGTSRVQVGIPVDHPAYGTGRVLNLGLNGTTLTETAAVLDHVLRTKRPKRILFGADFLLFSDVRGLGPGFENSRFNPDLEPLEYHFKNVLGSPMLADSWRLFRQWIQREPPAPASRGWITKSIRPGVNQREIFARNIRQFLTEPDRYAAFHYSPERLEMFRGMIRQCRQAGTELVVFIPPVHALQLETIRAAGLWPTFERWKSDLARILAEEGAVEAVPLWDFTGFAGFVAEPVPAANDKSTRMQWYFESSHFTPALGHLVLERMLKAANGSIPASDFGARLNTQNVSAHLLRLRADRTRYATAFPEDLRWLNRVAAESKGKSPRDNAEF